MFTSEQVASVPPPGVSGPTSIQFCPNNPNLIVYVNTVPKKRPVVQKTTTSSYKPLTNLSSPPGSYTHISSANERILYGLDLTNQTSFPLLNTPRTPYNKRKTAETMTLEERLRRERQRLTSSSTHFHWVNDSKLLVPSRGNLYLQTGVFPSSSSSSESFLLHDKSATGLNAADAVLSPDGTMVAFYCHGEVYVQRCLPKNSNHINTATEANLPEQFPVHQITFGSQISDSVSVTHGVADFVSQEEMDRYRGFWWHPNSTHIVFCKNDETDVPVYRIMHHNNSTTPLATPPAPPDSSMSENNSVDDTTSNNNKAASASSSVFEDHRYPFAGKLNPVVKLGILPVAHSEARRQENWSNVVYFDAPREANEYLARVYFCKQTGEIIAQWQNRAQNTTVLYKSSLDSAGRGRTLLVERSEVWINLNDCFRILDSPIHPEQTGCSFPMPNPLPEGSFSFLWGSERSGFCHLYLYTYCPNINSEQAVLIKTLTEGNWMVESVAGVDQNQDIVYFAGTCDSVLERHLYAVPLLGNQMMVEDDNSLPVVSSGSDEFKESSASSSPSQANGGVRRGLTKVMHALSGGKHKKLPEIPFRLLDRPTKLTTDSGMHSIVMDESCKYFVDTSSDLHRPTTVCVYELPTVERRTIRHVVTMYDAIFDDKSLVGGRGDLISALPAPELLSFPTLDGTETLHAALYRPDPNLHGPGPYPLVCAVYGGPHVQRVSRSWSQCADMRAQRLRSMGFCVIKCDNRGSSRRGLAFESAISRRLGRLEVLDQVAAVRQLTMRGIADSSRVGIYGWSYGGYLSAMCLCRAPDVFHVAVAGAPVTSWDGYDTHYTERYMGLPADNSAGYREAAVFDHVPNMRGRLMIVHGLIDENVHFQHTSRLINKLIAAGKEYDLLIFPEERHSPRRLRDRVYMEQRISDFFSRHLGPNPTALDLVSALGQGGSSGAPPALRTMAGRL